MKPLLCRTQIPDLSVKDKSQSNLGSANGSSSCLTKNSSELLNTENVTTHKHVSQSYGPMSESNIERGPKSTTDQTFKVPLVWGRPTEIGLPHKHDTITSEIKGNSFNCNASTSKISDSADDHVNSTFTPFLRNPRGLQSSNNSYVDKKITHKSTLKEVTSFIQNEAIIKKLEIQQESELGLNKDKKTETNCPELYSSAAKVPDKGFHENSKTVDFIKEEEKIESRILKHHGDRTTSVQIEDVTTVNKEERLHTPALFTRLRLLISNIKMAHGSRSAHEARCKAVSQRLEDFGYWDEISDNGSQISGYSQGSGIYLKKIREMEPDESQIKGNMYEPRSQLEELIMLCQSGDLLARDER
jgi:hypothetical protein